ncbi:DVU0772 family protein [Thermodesulfobacteriota bacterium]
MKKIGEVIKDNDVALIIDWELHPFDAVARYLEWGTNWSRGLDHAKSCNEESAYFKINAINKPAKLMLVRQSHSDYEVLSEIEAPQDLIDGSVEFFACKNRACGITDELRDWLRKEAAGTA